MFYIDASTAFTLIRSVLYIWLSSEFLFLAHLYAYGYTKYKKTNIIITLQRLFFVLGLLFSFMAFLPILLIFSNDGHTTFTLLLPLLIIPVGYFVRRFRCESIKETKMTLPKKDSKVV